MSFSFESFFIREKALYSHLCSRKHVLCFYCGHGQRKLHILVTRGQPIFTVLYQTDWVSIPTSGGLTQINEEIWLQGKWKKVDTFYFRLIEA